jgi:signal transduction histidine kinase
LIDRAVSAAGVLEGGLQILRDRTREDVALTTDLDRLVQVFVNVIANAQKYCTVAGPALQVKAHQVDGRDIIDFIDNGQGISVENQAMIFEKFARIEDEGKAGGAGLGLAICREILGRLGGQITYLPGHGGAAFRVILPSQNVTAKSAQALAS